MTIQRVPGGKQPLPIQDRGGAGPRVKDPLSAKNLVKLTKDLAVGFQDRIFGSAQGKKAAEWLAAQMKAIGLEPAQGDSYFQTFSTKVGKTELTGRNVVGLLRGTDPELSKEVLVVAGHFDTQQDTHVGANDNATGCAGVLEKHGIALLPEQELDDPVPWIQHGTASRATVWNCLFVHPEG